MSFNNLGEMKKSKSQMSFSNLGEMEKKANITQGREELWSGKKK